MQSYSKINSNLHQGFHRILKYQSQNFDFEIVFLYFSGKFSFSSSFEFSFSFNFSDSSNFDLFGGDDDGASTRLKSRFYIRRFYISRLCISVHSLTWIYVDVYHLHHQLHRSHLEVLRPHFLYLAISN